MIEDARSELDGVDMAGVGEQSPYLTADICVSWGGACIRKTLRCEPVLARGVYEDVETLETRVLPPPSKSTMMSFSRG